MPSADDKPWFAPQNPWAFWGDPTRKRMMNNGAPPQAVLTPAQERYGFAVQGGATLTMGGNSSGAAVGNFPATVGNVLNLSAASFGSAGAFMTRGRPNQ